MPTIAVGLFGYAGYALASGIAQTARRKRREQERELRSGVVSDPPPAR